MRESRGSPERGFGLRHRIGQELQRIEAASRESDVRRIRPCDSATGSRLCRVLSASTSVTHPDSGGSPKTSASRDGVGLVRRKSRRIVAKCAAHPSAAHACFTHSAYGHDVTQNALRSPLHDAVDQAVRTAACRRSGGCNAVCEFSAERVEPIAASISIGTRCPRGYSWRHQSRDGAYPRLCSLTLRGPGRRIGWHVTLNLKRACSARGTPASHVKVRDQIARLCLRLVAHFSSPSHAIGSV